MKLIAIGQREVMVVDDDLHDKLSSYHWHINHYGYGLEYMPNDYE